MAVAKFRSGGVNAWRELPLKALLGLGCRARSPSPQGKGNSSDIEEIPISVPKLGDCTSLSQYTLILAQKYN